jgi:hypothetical protein
MSLRNCAGAATSKCATCRQALWTSLNGMKAITGNSPFSWFSKKDAATDADGLTGKYSFEMEIASI